MTGTTTATKQAVHHRVYSPACHVRFPARSPQPPVDRAARSGIYMWICPLDRALNMARSRRGRSHGVYPIWRIRERSSQRGKQGTAGVSQTRTARYVTDESKRSTKRIERIERMGRIEGISAKGGGWEDRGTAQTSIELGADKRRSGISEEKDTEHERLTRSQRPQLRLVFLSPILV